MFREFSRGTFARHATVPVLHECRENFHVSRTSRELVAKVLKMFKNFVRILSQQNSQDCRATVVRRSHDVRASVTTVAAKF